MEGAKKLMEDCGIEEDPNKNDFTIVKRGPSIELTEARDIAGHAKFHTGTTTVALLMTFFEEGVFAGHVGNVFVIVSSHEDWTDFAAFMEKQARRHKFKLFLFVSPLPANEIAHLFGSTSLAGIRH
jgi:hypothetical protein